MMLAPQDALTLVRIDNPEVEIQGTSEIVFAVAKAHGVIRDGVAIWEHTGGSEVFWDTMTTQTGEGGRILFLDENGLDVPMSGVGVLMPDGTVKPLSTDD